MLRLLYLYPEEWTGHRAREVHTLETCLALTDAGADVTLVTAGHFDTQRALSALKREETPAHFTVVNLTRKIGPIRSASIFGWQFSIWLRSQAPFDLAYIIHLKAAAMLQRARIPYAWEAHEIFAETPEPGSRAEQELNELEHYTLHHAAKLIATSQALADALSKRYFPTGPQTFSIVPHGCAPPIIESVADPRGPLVYAGSIADWKGLPLALEAAVRLEIPVRVIGGNADEWHRLSAQISHAARDNIKWLPRVTPGKLLDLLRGARAGLCPTLPETGSGRYSLPMKIFDYARCGLPVVTTDLVSLRSLEVGDWCRRVARADVAAWTDALQEPFTNGEDARDWAVAHTWRKRGERLLAILESQPGA